MLSRKRKAKIRREKSQSKPKTSKEIEEQEEIVSSLNSPNVWTPKVEDEWLKQSGKTLNRRFPPIKKPPHVSRQGRRGGW